MKKNDILPIIFLIILLGGGIAFKEPVKSIESLCAPDSLMLYKAKFIEAESSYDSLNKIVTQTDILLMMEAHRVKNLIRENEEQRDLLLKTE
jgi:hypothetical protein